MEPRTDTRSWIGIDFDGTLVEYHEWLGPTTFGKPIPTMVELVKGLLAENKRVKIFTARMTDPRIDPRTGVSDVGEAIHRWCIRHLGEQLEVTNRKDFYMTKLYDDRAIQVETNTGRLIG